MIYKVMKWVNRSRSVVGFELLFGDDFAQNRKDRR